MSNAAPQSGEPTMEEILASIRRIISEEEGEQPTKAEEALPAVSAPARPAPPPPPEPDDEVLELTNIVPDDPPPAPKPRPVLVSPAADIAFEAPAPVVAAEPPAEGNLVSPDALARAASAFERLHSESSGSLGGGLTVEALVREALKPMLKQWLDENLPALVERLVAEEVERVASRRR